jgi:DNA (cytosine-5)-methyltransferase 1
MTHGSLFSGIGGFDLAAEWMGWENLFHCEFNPFCQRILKYYWPNSKSYGDITKSTFTEFRGRIDILTGGFPCQPFSTAGKRKGTDDSRYLWPEMLRVIREVQPRYIVGENVRGLVSWDGGLVFDTVCSDLEAEGYEVLPVLLPAAGVNAPHLRQRIFFIAHSVNSGHCTKRGEISKEDRIQEINRQTMDSWEFDGTNLSSEIIAHANHKGGSSGLGQVQSENGEISERDNDAEFSDSSNGIASDTDSTNSQTRTQREILGKSDREKTNGHCNVECTNKWENFPTVSPICNGDDGLSDRLDSITFSKWRNESIKGGGNAIVPQVALEIFKVIDKLNK